MAQASDLTTWQCFFQYGERLQVRDICIVNAISWAHGGGGGMHGRVARQKIFFNSNPHFANPEVLSFRPTRATKNGLSRVCISFRWREREEGERWLFRPESARVTKL